MNLKLKPWGWYLTLWTGKRFKIKFLYFKRDGEISHQKHKNRDELWCFLFGKGRFHHNNVGYNIGKGEARYINAEDWHHYKAYKRTLVLEVQTGLCREEDIERR